MGLCKITYYCPCSRCSGKWQRKTATQTTAKAGRTVAVDPDVIAYGTILDIDGKTYIAEDCGAHVKGDHIDIFVDSHDEVERLGKTKKLVLITGRKKID